MARKRITRRRRQPAPVLAPNQIGPGEFFTVLDDEVVAWAVGEARDGRPQLLEWMLEQEPAATEHLHLTDEFRQFVLDLMCGRIKRPRGRLPELNLQGKQAKLYYRVRQLERAGDPHKAAVSKTAEEFGVSTRTVYEAMRVFSPAVKLNTEMPSAVSG